MPGLLIQGNHEGDRANLRRAPSGRTATGQHVELSRALETESEYDHDFAPGRDLYMWLNVFDHTQIRHTTPGTRGPCAWCCRSAIGLLPVAAVRSADYTNGLYF